MTQAVVFGFAAQDGLVPVVGTAPYDVLARQIPRQLVQLLNASGDRGVRFFPFLGNAGGKRTFLRLRELLPVATLASLHKNEDVLWLVDGALLPDRLVVRIHDADTQLLRREVELPFDPRRPFEPLLRLQFEVMSALGWEGRPTSAPAVPEPALAWYAIAKDELLAMEAAVPPVPPADRLRAVRQCIGLAPACAPVQDIALEMVAQWLRAQQPPSEAAELLRSVADAAPLGPELCRRIGALQQAAGDELGAAATWTRAAALQPGNPEVVEIAASLWFRAGRLDEAFEVLMAARRLGALGPGGLGQLAAVADRRGDRALRAELTAELVARPQLPLAVARLIASFLLEEDRAREALTVLERALAEAPQDAGLWLECGRAHLLLDHGERALVALRRALEQGLKGEPRRDAERLLRLGQVPGLFQAMRTVDASLAAGDALGALRTARVMVRRAADSAESWLFLGVVRQRLGHPWRAERAFRRALALEENLGEAHNRLGILLVGHGRADQGVQHLLRAQLLSPGDPSPRLHLAQAYAMQGKHRDGELQLAQAERLGASAQLLAAIRRQFFAQGA